MDARGVSVFVRIPTIGETVPIGGLTPKCKPLSSHFRPMQRSRISQARRRRGSRGGAGADPASDGVRGSADEAPG